MFPVIYYQLFQTQLLRIPHYIGTHCSFPTPALNQPCYFELVKNVHKNTATFYLSSSCIIDDLTMLDSIVSGRVRSFKHSRLAHITVCLLLREPRFDGKQASCHSRSTKV